MKHLLIVFFLLSLSGSLYAQNKLDRPGFYLEYPVSWLIDKNSPGYNADGFFTIQADPYNHIMFLILDEKTDPAMLLDLQQKEYQNRVLTNSSGYSQFTSWGSFKGNGRELKGKLAGKGPGVVRMFVVQSGNKTFMVTTQTVESEARKLGQGFTLIEKSFRFK